MIVMHVMLAPGLIVAGGRQATARAAADQERILRIRVHACNANRCLSRRLGQRLFAFLGGSYLGVLETRAALRAGPAAPASGRRVAGSCRLRRLSGLRGSLRCGLRRRLIGSLCSVRRLSGRSGRFRHSFGLFLGCGKSF